MSRNPNFGQAHETCGGKNELSVILTVPNKWSKETLKKTKAVTDESQKSNLNSANLIRNRRIYFE